MGEGVADESAVPFFSGASRTIVLHGAAFKDGTAAPPPSLKRAGLLFFAENVVIAGVGAVEVPVSGVLDAFLTKQSSIARHHQRARVQC